MENIKVAIRIRPFLSKENSNNTFMKSTGENDQKIQLSKGSKIFKGYFDKIKPNIIKNNEKNYEFSFDDIKNVNFNFLEISEERMKKIYDIYKFFQFFLIFIDIQSTASRKVLESFVDKLIDCSPDSTKKCYIFGVYKEEDKIVNKEEQIITILNSKGIDYEYATIDNNFNENFPKGLEYLIRDSTEIMEEISFEERDNYKFGKDKGRSCQII